MTCSSNKNQAVVQGGNKVLLVESVQEIPSSEYVLPKEPLSGSTNTSVSILVYYVGLLGPYQVLISSLGFYVSFRECYETSAVKFVHAVG